MIKKHSDLIILTIIGIISIFSVFMVFIKSYEIGIQNYIGYGLFIGISILRIFKFRRINLLLGLLLVIGSTNTIQFTYSTIIFSFNLSWNALKDSSMSLGFQPLCALLLIFLIIVHRSSVVSFLRDLFHEDPEMAEMRQKLIGDKHYNQLLTVNDLNLQEIIDSKNMYQVEYVKAALRIAEERKTNKTDLSDKT